MWVTGLVVHPGCKPGASEQGVFDSLHPHHLPDYQNWHMDRFQTPGFWVRVPGWVQPTAHAEASHS